MRKILGAFALCALVSGPALAQEAPGAAPMPAPAEAPTTADLTPLNSIADHATLVGKTVETTDGAEVGQVEGVQPDGFLVVSGGMLSAPVTVPPDLMGLNEGDDVLVLLLTESDLRSQLGN